MLDDARALLVCEVVYTEGAPEGRALLAESKVVLVSLGSPPQRRLAVAPDFQEVARDARAVLYLRS